MKIVNLLSQGTRIHLDQIFALVQKYKILTQCRGNRAHVKKRKRAWWVRVANTEQVSKHMQTKYGIGPRTIVSLIERLVNHTFNLTMISSHPII